MALPSVIEGSKYDPIDITWADEDGTARDLTGATLTGRLKNEETSEITVIDGSLVLLDADDGIFTWTLGDNDVGTVGKFFVQFIATYAGGESARSVAERWCVNDAFDIDPS